MSTQRPQPELSAYFIREKRILKAADTAKYNTRLKEIDLPDDYAIYGYEPSSGRKPAAYWVCKQSVGKCPECGTPYLEDAIASVSESKLTHYCRVEIPHEGRKPTYEIHPATLYLRRIRWLCYNCYSEQKTYNARMQDDSKLVDKEDKKLTLQVKEHLGQQAMHMEINTLAEIFDISPHTVDKCFDKAVDKYDKERDWDNISTLGLYTITLNVQGQQADCCLCANVDTEKLIEFFPYEDTKAAEAFLSKLKNKQNIQRVFTSIDSAAFDFAKTNFPIETIMVDRLDVRKRLECALEPHKEAVLAKFAENPNYPPKAMYRISGYQFYNTSPYTLKELCNEPDNIKSNFKVYIQGFSAEVQEIFNGLEMFSHIDKMDKDGCLFSVVQAFADLDLDPKTYDSIKMGYIFEHLIGKFYQNVDAGQFYTGRDIIKCLVAVLISEGCDDIFDDGKVVTVCDQACGTGDMLSTAYSFIKHYNPSADVRLFGQEFMPQSYAVGLAEMMIKGQNIENFRNADTFKEDCFPNIKMRFVLENPPFGTPWAGKDAKAGQEDAVRNEFKRGKKGRWGAGLPSGGDSQLIFMQSAIDKMDDKVGRAAIIENNSPLFTGGTASGESQIRRWILEQDLLEAIIALPTDLFYNTGIATYVWILSKNKRPERKGYVQLIDATSIFHKLRKAAGNKKNELLPEDRSKIVKLYTAFEKNEYCKIFKKEEFLYREYTVMQPLQRSYAITEERIDQMLADGTLNSVYDPAKVDELEEQGAQISVKDKMKLDKLYEQKPIYEAVISALQDAVSDEVYLSPEVFMPVLRKALAKVTDDKKLLDKIADGLSVMDKNAEIQRDKHGAILYDKDSKDTERVPYEESIDDYMAREVLPHVPDAKAFWEEKADAKKPVIKTGAEIPFTQYFYKYEQPVPSKELAKQFMELEQSVSQRIAKLFG